MAPRVYGRSRTNSVRRATGWEIGVKSGAAGALLSLSASGASLGGVTVTQITDGFTLVRTRGEFLAYLKTSAAAASGFHGAFGIGIASDAALAVGVSAIPTPITEEAWDGWLYHRYFSLFSSAAMSANAAEDVDFPMAVSAGVRFEVDSKAMRKLRVNESCYCCVEVTEIGACTMDWAFNSRTLIKLP